MLREVVAALHALVRAGHSEVPRGAAALRRMVPATLRIARTLAVHQALWPEECTAAAIAEEARGAAARLGVRGGMQWGPAAATMVGDSGVGALRESIRAVTVAVVAKPTETASGSVPRGHGVRHTDHMASAGGRDVTWVVAEGLEGHGIVRLERVDRHATTRVDMPHTAYARHTHAHAHTRRTRRVGCGSGGDMQHRDRLAPAVLRRDDERLATGAGGRVETARDSLFPSNC